MKFSLESLQITNCETNHRKSAKQGTPDRASNGMIERKTYFIASKTRMLSEDKSKK